MGEEERIWDIDASVREKFNAKSLYELALREDIPWRQWNHWVREKIVTYLRENNRIAPPQVNQGWNQQQHTKHPSYGHLPSPQQPQPQMQPFYSAPQPQSNPMNTAWNVDPQQIQNFPIGAAAVSNDQNAQSSSGNGDDAKQDKDNADCSLM